MVGAGSSHGVRRRRMHAKFSWKTQKERDYQDDLDVCGKVILWRIDPFLGNDRGKNNNTTAVARLQILNKQQLNYNNRGTVGSGVFCGPRCGLCYAAGR
jgi:hypothetical protein